MSYFVKNANHFNKVLGDWDGLKAFNFGRDIGNELVAIKIRVVAAVNEQVNELGGLLV